MSISSLWVMRTAGDGVAEFHFNFFTRGSKLPSDFVGFGHGRNGLNTVQSNFFAAAPAIMK